MRRPRTSASKPSGQFVEPKIREHRGRTLKNTDDGFLSEFSSVTDAVRCAIEIQRGMLDRERSVPKERRILFRIGINLGDVIFEEHDIFGHRVNVTFASKPSLSPSRPLPIGAARIGVDSSGVTLTIKPQLDGVNVPAEEPMVRRLSTGGKWIRTSGSAMRSHRQQRSPGRAF
jgi:hypothetical protein